MSAVEHHIEQRAVVWLHLVDGQWEIDSPSDDGSPLEGYDDGPLHEECECDGEVEGERLRQDAPDVPTLLELYALLTRYFDPAPESESFAPIVMLDELEEWEEEWQTGRILPDDAYMLMCGHVGCTSTTFIEVAKAERWNEFSIAYDDEHETIVGSIAQDSAHFETDGFFCGEWHPADFEAADLDWY